jgi:hypothetical protein
MMNIAIVAIAPSHTLSSTRVHVYVLEYVPEYVHVRTLVLEYVRICADLWDFRFVACSYSEYHGTRT